MEIVGAESASQRLTHTLGAASGASSANLEDHRLALVGGRIVGLRQTLQ